MRILILATAASALAAVPVVAQAQHALRPGASMPRPGGAHWRQPGMRWGNKVGGRWWIGSRAPGGWAGYRAPMIGWTMPRYWIAPSYYVTNWSAYGLPTPPANHYWSRYYDDAVMIDADGRVRDYRAGLDWDRYDNGAYTVETYVDGKLVDRHELAGDGYAEDLRSPPPPPPPVPSAQRRDGAATGAVVGAVAGGVAGNVIAGRGNRTAGTIVGAGVGAVAGAAIGGADDRRRDRHEPPVAPYGAPYPPPRNVPIAPDGPPPPIEFGPREEIVQGMDRGVHRERRIIVKRHGEGNGVTVDTGAHGDKPYTTVIRGPGTVTTVTVVPARTTTTTTIKYAEPIVYRKAVTSTYRAKPRATKTVRRYAK